MNLPTPLESEILKQCLQYLHLRGWLAWRNNSGAMSGDHKGKKWYVRFNSAAGSSDIFAIEPGTGRFWSIEVKRPGKHPTDHQAEWLERVRAAGGVGIVVRSAADLEQALKARGM